MELLLITGMSGSGKSVALNALEDAGYYCVDNLPPELLLSLVTLGQARQDRRLAIAIDVRSAKSLPLVPQLFNTLRQQKVAIKVLFLDADTDTLVRRYSESRRKHPLSQDLRSNPQSDDQHALIQAIEQERELLADLRQTAQVIDTSMIRASQLQGYVKDLLATQSEQLVLVFESFAFKRGVPREADFMFDVRMLPNPHWDDDLRVLTGRDAKVARFLEQQPEVAQMLTQVEQFLQHWLPALARDHRSYVTVAIGCTGGQHRSVYLVEQLAQKFGPQWTTLKRHRELVAP